MSTDKDYLLELYKIEAAKYSSVREINWRINTSLATVLILAIYGKAKDEFNLDGVNRYCQILIYAACLLLHAILIYRINMSFSKTLNRMHNIAKYLFDDNTTSGIKLEKIIKIPAKTNFAWQYLILGITIFLIIIFDIFQKTALHS
jgi:hypothetical protein